jgi:hypothetical protein
MLRFLLLAVLAAAMAGVTAGGALAHGARLPDAEIFATNNTAVITDPGDPRLSDPLRAFERKVQRIVERGGGEPRLPAPGTVCRRTPPFDAAPGA